MTTTTIDPREYGAVYNVYAGVCFLAENDTDRAAQENGIGFNGRDVEFGHSLAERPFSSWTPKMYRAAYKMLRTYRNTQLPLAGIDDDNLLPRLPNGCKYIAAADHQTEDGTWVYGLSVDGELIEQHTDFAIIGCRALFLNGLLKGIDHRLAREEAYRLTDAA